MSRSYEPHVHVLLKAEPIEPCYKHNELVNISEESHTAAHAFVSRFRLVAPALVSLSLSMFMFSLSPTSCA